MGIWLNHKELRELNKIILAVAIIEPLTTLPQIIQVFSASDVSGVSVLTWVLYALLEVIWVFYGLVIRSKPVIITNCLWIVMDLAVVVGVLAKS